MKSNQTCGLKRSTEMKNHADSMDSTRGLGSCHICGCKKKFAIINISRLTMVALLSMFSEEKKTCSDAASRLLWASRLVHEAP
jgi:hypothetical protein